MRRPEGGSREGLPRSLGVRSSRTRSRPPSLLRRAISARRDRSVRRRKAVTSRRRRTAFQAGDIQGVLTGKTVAGTPITATDSVAIVPPT